MTAINALAANTPRPSTAAAIGASHTAPVATPAAGNAATPTAFVAPRNTATAVGGGPATDITTSINNAARATGTTPTAARSAVNTVSNQFGAPIANDLASATGGGAITDALANGVARIAAFAQNGMKSIEKAIQADMTANNGQVDPAKMQQYTMQMSTFETIMKMAAKIQESQDAAMQVWLR